MDWFKAAAAPGAVADLHRKLREAGFVFETTVPGDSAALRRDVERIAGHMDRASGTPPMLWSGIPWPAPGPAPSCGFHLVISIGGTKTDFALLRLENGRVVALDPTTGRETGDQEEIHRIKSATQMATPRYSREVPTGHTMVEAMVGHLAGHLQQHREALDRTEGVLLSFGFANRVVRTGPRLRGGLSAIVTKMTKEQAPFTADLAGKNIGLLFEEGFRRKMNWSRPVAVANDTVMALHYFLDPSRREGHARVGLFINGTGTNFAAAEPYAVRAEGVISRSGEEYCPERVTRLRPLKPGEREELYFVNYETGSVTLEATNTRFDLKKDYQIEENALAGGNAYAQMLRGTASELLSPALLQALTHNWSHSGHSPDGQIGSLAVSLLARDVDDPKLFPAGSPLQARQAEVRHLAKAIVARSAAHAALILAAVTTRTGFGLGRDGMPDLLGMEGSVWKIPGYQPLVREYWQALLGAPRLSVDLASEPSYNASLSGPLYLAALNA